MESLDTFIVMYLPYIVVGLSALYQWYLSEGSLKKAYRLSFFLFTGYMVVETAVALRHPDQIHLIVFNFVNVWALYMNFRGYQRLKRIDCL